VEPPPPEASAATPDASVPFEVVFEDEHLVVVDKPPGVVVHPARGHAGGTLVNGLLGRGIIRPITTPSGISPRAAGTEVPPSDIAYARPGIVHRLDKGTSGILVVAKDDPTREALKRLFSVHAIERAYVAVVVGRAQDATYDTLHGRHPTDRLRFTSRVNRGKRAVTHVKVLERFDRSGASYVECRLETGRTHQIRVHLSERAKTPILGDPYYGRSPASPFLRALATDLGHQALHAARLGFVHPTTGHTLRFERPPPPDFAKVLLQLRGAES
jgi:23S rRNA pseudouridine1911/1915/1917 synthase